MIRLLQNCTLMPKKIVNDNVLQLFYLTVHVDNSWSNVKGEHIQFHNAIDFFFSLEADQHENVRQEVVCKRWGFNSVVRYTSSVFNWRTVWTFCRDVLWNNHPRLKTVLPWKLKFPFFWESCRTLLFAFTRTANTVDTRGKYLGTENCSQVSLCGFF